MHPCECSYFEEGKVREEKVKVGNSEGVSAASVDEVDVTKVPRPCQLGSNLYAKDRKGSAKKPEAKDAALHKHKPFEPNDVPPASTILSLTLALSAVPHLNLCSVVEESGKSGAEFVSNDGWRRLLFSGENHAQQLIS